MKSLMLKRSLSLCVCISVCSVATLYEDMIHAFGYEVGGEDNTVGRMQRGGH